MNRRDFLHLSLAASALALGQAFAAPQLPPATTTDAKRGKAKSKRGLGIAAGKDPLWREKLQALEARWFYNWLAGAPEKIPDGLEFIPMIFRGMPEANFARVADKLKSNGKRPLLGFNEPDVADQGNMTVEQALDAWPLLMKTGLRLGSPACAHPDREWMIEFMAGVKKRKLRVDFICVHSYGGPSAEALVNRLEKVHEMFDRPIWITEFAVGDWKAKTVAENQHDPETVQRFMEKVLPMLDRLSFVERYAWFSAGQNSAPLGTSALFDKTGALTRLGKCYRDA